MRSSKSYHLVISVKISGDSGTRATRTEPELQNDAEATPALGLSLSYEMMEGLLLFKF